jgi:hypothetical protein
MNDAQRAALANLQTRYAHRGVDVHPFEGQDNTMHVIVYGRITGAEVAVHAIALDGHIDDEATPDPTTPETS